MGLQSIFQRYKVQEYPLKAERYVELAVVITLGIFVLTLLLSALDSVTMGLSPVAPSEESMQAKEVRKMAVLEQDGSDKILARPLYWEERRPVDALAATEVSSEPKADKVEKLDGVEIRGVFGAADALGLIVVIDGKQKQRIAPGETIKGWSVDGINNGEIVLSNGRRKATLVLETSTPAVSIARQQESQPETNMSQPPEPNPSEDLSDRELRAMMEQARNQMRARQQGASKPRGSEGPEASKRQDDGGGLTLGGYSSN